jgi:glycosyltransferase involved in cell wall biosynthesis
MVTDAMPEVSVCIPTYNSAPYLRQAIESVLGQEFGDYELIVCDDASTDATPELCRSYRDPRLRYLRYEENAGQAGNFNRCLREARGEFLTLLHADDYFLPGFVTDRVRRLKERPELGFVFGAVQMVDAEDTPLSVSQRWPDDRFFQPGELLDSLLLGCIVSPPSLMVRRACAEAAGLFRTDLTWGHDWEWALRLAERAAACYASKPLAAYRVHDGSGTAAQLSAAKNGRQERRILQETFARLIARDHRFRKLRRPALQALSRRHMYFAEQALLGGRRAVTRNNLRYAALADAGMLARPTFWALLCGSLGPVAWYSRYRALRQAAA